MSDTRTTDLEQAKALVDEATEALMEMAGPIGVLALHLEMALTMAADKERIDLVNDHLTTAVCRLATLAVVLDGLRVESPVSA